MQIFHTIKSYNGFMTANVKIKLCGLPIKLCGFLSLIINLLCHVYDRLCCLSNVKLSWQRQVMMYWFMSMS